MSKSYRWWNGKFMELTDAEFLDMAGRNEYTLIAESKLKYYLALEAQLAASEAENAGYRAELKGLYVKNDASAASEARLREALISGTEGGGVFWRENALAAPPSPGAALFAQMEEALKWIGTANVHVGNDDNGNMFGPPDKVMCRNRALEALAALKAWRDGG